MIFLLIFLFLEVLKRPFSPFLVKTCVFFQYLRRVLVYDYRITGDKGKKKIIKSCHHF